MDAARDVPAYEVFVYRGPRRLKVRERFPSLAAARAYVREQWAARSLGFWWEADKPSQLTGGLMILAGDESYHILPAAHLHLCRAPRPRSGQAAASDAASPGRRLTGICFREWVSYAFDHPVPEDTSDAWYWQADRDHWREAEDPATTVGYLTRLFEEAPRVLQRFTDAQIAQGLYFLINNSLSEHMYPLMDPTVAWPARRRCIRSMYRVFERVFAPRCSPRLSHVLTEHDSTINPLNNVCYMWWDVCPLQGHAGPSEREDFMLETEELVDAGPPVDPFAAELEDEILDVLRRTLELEAIACQEGALHGLGHRAYRHPEPITTIIEEFLRRHYPVWPDEPLGESLRGYALAARQGRVQ
jgi:hypothetical protein